MMVFIICDLNRRPVWTRQNRPCEVMTRIMKCAVSKVQCNDLKIKINEFFTCMRGMSFERFFFMSSNHCSGSLRGEKSVTTAPRPRSDTKPGITSPAVPCSKWNWMSKLLHSCLVGAKQQRSHIICRYICRPGPTPCHSEQMGARTIKRIPTKTLVI